MKNRQKRKDDSKELMLEDKDLFPKIDEKKGGSEVVSDIKRVIEVMTGSKNTDLAIEMMYFGARASPTFQNKDTGHKTNVVIQAIDEAGAKDSIEARLAIQSHVLYAHGMEYLARAEDSEIPHHAEIRMNLAVKLLRLHNETIETLNRYRRKGEQKVLVQHVHVSGGQAVVSNELIARGGGIQKLTRYPMVKECGAKTRTSDCHPCHRYAMANGRCHLLGGKSTGAKTDHGKLKQKMASWKHGLRSKEIASERKFIRELLNITKNL